MILVFNLLLRVPDKGPKSAKRHLWTQAWEEAADSGTVAGKGKLGSQREDPMLPGDCSQMSWWRPGRQAT